MIIIPGTEASEKGVKDVTFDDHVRHCFDYVILCFIEVKNVTFGDHVKHLFIGIKYFT